MAGLNTMFPQGSLSGTGALEGFTLGDQINMAKQNNALEQQKAIQEQLKAQQEYEQAQKTNPIEVLKKQADLEGTNLDNQTKQQTFDFNKRTEDSRYTKFVDEAAKAHTQAELEQTMAQLQKDLWSPDPKISQAAQHQFQMTADVLKKQLEIKQQGDNAIAVANIGLAGTKYTADAATKRAETKAAKSSTIDWRKIVYSKNDPVSQYSTLQAFSNDDRVSDEDKQQIAAMMMTLHTTANAALKLKTSPFVMGADGKFGPNPDMQTPGIPAPNVAPPAAQPKTVQEAIKAGWTLHVDGKGNKAYVGPNKQYIEVK